jgi:hypothetical protein
MPLPFTTEQFHAVFRAYNEAVWPVQIVLLVLAAIALAAAARPSRHGGVVVAATLMLLWAWMGVAYHRAFFRAINPLAPLFAALSLAGAVAFGWHGVVHRRLHFRLCCDARSLVAVLLIGYALAVYPLWSLWAGQRWPDLVTFGLPCPTTIFTIGLLCATAAPLPRSVLLAPLAWCAVGGQAALWLDVPQDFGLFAAGLAGLMLLLRPRRAPAPAPAPEARIGG